MNILTEGEFLVLRYARGLYHVQQEPRCSMWVPLFGYISQGAPVAQ
jgi:hypothetical protein